MLAYRLHQGIPMQVLLGRCRQDVHPSLAELLRRPDDRSETFYLGHTEYDPADVGYLNEGFSGAFLFDTTLHGNSNAGHDYGTGLSEEEKLQLIEYIKTL